MKMFRTVLGIQFLYILITAIWPLVYIESFMAVTGYKVDIWLVKTVSVLLISIGSCMVAHLLIRTDHRPVVVLCITSSIAFIGIDFYYALNDTISNVYMVDGGVQIVFLLAWIYIAAAHYKVLRQSGSES